MAHLNPRDVEKRAAEIQQTMEQAIQKLLSSPAHLTFDQAGIDRVRDAIQKSIGVKVGNPDWVCKPHRWIGWDGHRCQTCEELGINLMQKWPPEAV